MKVLTQPNSSSKLFISAIALLLLLANMTFATTPPPDENVFNYQGRVVVNDVNFDGEGDCRFAILDENDQFLWSNSMLGGNVPMTAVACQATNGLVSVLLGG